MSSPYVPVEPVAHARRARPYDEEAIMSTPAGTSVDLLSLIGTDTSLRYVAATNGGEYAGKCPLPGCSSQHDALRVQPNAPSGPRWWCRACSPDDRWHGPAEYLVRRDGISIAEALQRLNGQPVSTAIPPDDPQTYPDRHGCTWADFTKWGAYLGTYTDRRHNKDGSPLPTTGQSFPAIFFPDSTGGRWRLFGHPDSKFMSAQTNQAACWYGLTEAVNLAQSQGLDFLVIVNGQPSVIVCQVHGVPAITIPGGENSIANKIERELSVTLQALWQGRIIILLDGDKTGYKYAPKVADVLRNPAHGGYTVEIKDPGKGLDAADVCRLNNGTCLAAILTLPEYQPPSAIPPQQTGPIQTQTSPAVTSPQPDPRTRIDITDLDIPVVMEQVWNTVIAANNPPQLFVCANTLTRLEKNDDTGRYALATADTKRLRGLFARQCIFQETKHRKTHIKEPPKAVIDDALVNPDPRLPLLNRIVRCPTFAPDGTLQDTPGYHATGRIYYDQPPDLIIPPVSIQPTESEMLAARQIIIDELLSGFPFVSEADQAHAIALLLLSFVRDMIAGPTPLHLIEAPAVGTGKTLLADVCLMVSTGKRPIPKPGAANDDEWRKRITSSLLELPSELLFDNINHTLDSGSLAAALVATDWGDRVLQVSQNANVPIRCTWVATANNPSLSLEIARRCIRIRIDSRTDRPHLRSGFCHPDLHAWTREHRGELICAALTLVRYGIQGPPKIADSRVLGSYEVWAALMGRILTNCGIRGFLENLEDLYDRADTEGAAWRELLALWQHNHGQSDVAVSELYTLVVTNDVPLTLRGRTDLALKTAFGIALNKIADQVFSIVCIDGQIRSLRVTPAGKVGNARHWRLVETSPPTPSPAGIPTSTQTAQQIDIIQQSATSSLGSISNVSPELSCNNDLHDLRDHAHVHVDDGMPKPYSGHRGYFPPPVYPWPAIWHAVSGDIELSIIGEFERGDQADLFLKTNYGQGGVPASQVEFLDLDPAAIRELVSRGQPDKIAKQLTPFGVDLAAIIAWAQTEQEQS